MTEKIRPPAVAGQFYPADPQRLKAELEKLLAQLPQRNDGKRARAAVLPHAGYIYSGLTAMKTIALARGGGYERAVVIAPSHRVGFEGLATASYSAYKTPLGEIPVDKDAMASVLASPFIREIDQAHAKEHSLEVELPLLQAALPPMPIAPFVCGQLRLDMAKELAKALLPLWKPENLWLISSDFTHYGAAFNYTPFVEDVPNRLRNLDIAAAEKIAAQDLDGFEEFMAATRATICGEAPIKLLLATILASGDKLSGRVVDYSSSGEATRDWSHCVGYAGLVFEQ